MKRSDFFGDLYFLDDGLYVAYCVKTVVLVTSI